MKPSSNDQRHRRNLKSDQSFISIDDMTVLKGGNGNIISR